jgi:coenzyme F420-reducing hydrogenase alpha subunit
MGQTLDINVHHITRLEGHGNIRVRATDGKLEDCKLEIVESPRFYEAMLRGRKYTEAVHITCRICGICSCGHTCASLRGMEAALGITPSEQTVVLRKLLLDGEFLESHVLHVFYLAVPDLLGVGSVIPLVETHRPVVEIALRLKRLANDICGVVAGRHIHPIAAVVNGFSKLPKLADLLPLRDRLVAARQDMAVAGGVLATLTWPDLQRETEYISLTHPTEYALYEGTIKSSLGGELDPQNYLEWVNEYLVPHSSAKFVRSPRSQSYAVGALARFNNNADQLCEPAQQVAAALGLKAPSYNPFMNNVAQVVETIQVIETALERINWLEEHGIHEEDRSVKVKAGRGVGAVEVPRGILFHDYTVDAEGRIAAANLIIPTGQNLANIEYDMRKWVPEIIHEPQEDIRLKLEMLVRAYDPCISCSCHLLDVEFV